jgi:hypothetical protein
MEVKVKLGDFNGQSTVLSATKEAIISNAKGSSQRDFSVFMDGFEDPELKEVSVHPQKNNGLEFIIEVASGWVVRIRQDKIYGDGSSLIISRFNRDVEKVSPVKWEYLTKDGNWLLKKGLGDLPNNVLRIPIFTPKKK